MKNMRKRAMVLLGLAAVLVLGWRLGVRSEVKAATAAVPTAPAVPSAPAPRPSAPSVGVPQPVPAAPGRTELLRPAAPTAVAPKAIAQPPPDRPTPVDRRGTTSPRAQHELEVLSYGFETLDEDLQACLDQWTALDPKKTPEVMIGFELDASGLTRSFVEGDDEVPFGPKTCLANAVYGIDWSHIVEQPAKVTKRFAITARDGGAP